MKRLILILNGKGGVGKSFFAVNLVQFFKDQHIAHVAFDSDNENSTLKRFHPEAGFIDLSIPRDLDRILEALENHALVVVDCRAASTDLFLDYFREIRLSEVLKTLQAYLTLIIPINHEPDSLDQVQRLSDDLGSGAQYLIVRNAAHSESFALYETSVVKTHILGSLEGRDISMSRMPDWLVEALNRENATPTTAKSQPAFSLLDRQRLQSWQRRLYDQLEIVRSLLVPMP